MPNGTYGGVRGRKMKVGGNDHIIFLLLDCLEHRGPQRKNLCGPLYHLWLKTIGERGGSYGSDSSRIPFLFLLLRLIIQCRAILLAENLFRFVADIFGRYLAVVGNFRVHHFCVA